MAYLQSKLPAVLSLALACACMQARASDPASPETTQIPGAAKPPAAHDPMEARASLDRYIDRLRHRIMQAWTPPREHKKANTVVTFAVSKVGIVSNARVTASSGDAAADQLCLETVNKLSPFDELPPAGGENLTIDFAFEYRALDRGETAEESTLEKRQRAFEENPHDGKAAFEYGKALRFANYFEEAISTLNVAIKSGYPGIAPLLEIAQAQNKLGNKGEAENTLKEAIKQNPTAAAAYRQLGDLFYEQKRWGEAKASYAEFLKLQPTGPVSELASMRSQLCQRRLDGESDADE